MAHGVQNKPKNEPIPDDSLPFYPAYCYKASPTHFTWVKLTAVNVHRLTRREGYEGQNIHFYKNHPIQFICLAGVIVSRDEQFRRTILTLDDSSGSNIEIVCSKKQFDLPVSQPAQAEVNPTVMATSTAQISGYITSTTKEALEISSLVPGVVAKFKGTVVTFRGMRQLHLERFVLLPDMAREMKFWEERTRFLVDVLSVPWHLTEEQVEQLRIEGAGLEEKKIKRSRAREERARRDKKTAEREEKDYERIVRRYQREEEVRRKYAELSRKVSARFKRPRGR
ncbi:OB-fold nucleic acid binding domain-containing protein [Nannizzia gypsea CBS 118893]|uniref:OB-fold nucleic acid binding domain-containing protein n=1 Tax=Arthroderma gypseum (strain ATCC MYA-4604 / CBS 118893) TaxID=535722 RepID=E4UQU6_ARTGP|nr:OB-fold nucleic acid binding domain-containing protein [Nannizzia gypsea CBS 118893]EFQ99272.1 OB-fold nucleic acid binding domain-containing protein [Nannizzia gypsea CBS 118893]